MYAGQAHNHCALIFPGHGKQVVNCWFIGQALGSRSCLCTWGGRGLVHASLPGMHCIMCFGQHTWLELACMLLYAWHPLMNRIDQCALVAQAAAAERTPFEEHGCLKPWDAGQAMHDVLCRLVMSIVTKCNMFLQSLYPLRG